MLQNIFSSCPGFATAFAVITMHWRWSIILSMVGLLGTVHAFVIPLSRSGRILVVPLRQAGAESKLEVDGPCPGYPKCSGEYREKGCDGTGRIVGGVGAFFEWWPVKAYRPCPSFTAAKYKYDRQGQTLNEVVFGSGGEDEAPTIIDRMAGFSDDEEIGIKDQEDMDNPID
ncbi:unnamed protein product [Choristocarpus tenellus]